MGVTERPLYTFLWLKHFLRRNRKVSGNMMVGAYLELGCAQTKHST